MRRTPVLVGSSLIYLMLVASPVAIAVETTTPELSVTQSAHKGERLWPVGPPFSGDLLIDQRITLSYEVHNAGQDPVDVVFRWHADPSPFGPDINFWTLPADTTGMAYQGAPRDCDSDTMKCEFRLGSDRSYAILVWLRGNAPGRFESYATASSERDGQVLTETFETQVTCSVVGTDSDDVLRGTDEKDSFCGGGGDDLIVAATRKDKAFGGAGDDVFAGRPGSQFLVGGFGRDRVDYSRATHGVMVFLNDGAQVGWGSDDLLMIEDVFGSRHDDYLEGTRRSNKLFGGGGIDQIFGRSGRDRLFGGRSADRFISRDQMIDLVSGGAGDDQGWVDPRDRRRSAQPTSSAPFADRDSS